MLSLFIILWFVDLFVFAFAVDNTTKNGIGGMIMFANEVSVHELATLFLFHFFHPNQFHSTPFSWLAL
jgi:hypothetical protein